MAIPHFLSIHQLMDILVIRTNNIMNTVYQFLCEHVSSSLVYVPRVELLGHMVTLCLTFEGSANLFLQQPHHPKFHQQCVF